MNQSETISGPLITGTTFTENGNPHQSITIATVRDNQMYFNLLPSKTSSGDI